MLKTFPQMMPGSSRADFPTSPRPKSKARPSLGFTFSPKTKILFYRSNLQQKGWVGPYGEEAAATRLGLIQQLLAF